MADIAKRRRLKECERTLAEHMEEFVKVGLALKEIRDERLYKEDGFNTFEDYCRNRWEMGRSYADHLIGSAELRTRIPDPPKTATNSRQSWNETQVRELKRLGSTTRARAVATRVVKEVEQANGKLTANVVRRHVDEALGIDRAAQAKATKAKRDRGIPFEDVIQRWTGDIQGMADVIEKVIDDEAGDALAFFGKTRPRLAKNLATAIERLEKSLTRVWESLPS